MGWYDEASPLTYLTFLAIRMTYEEYQDLLETADMPSEISQHSTPVNTRTSSL